MAYLTVTSLLDPLGPTLGLVRPSDPFPIVVRTFAIVPDYAVHLAVPKVPVVHASNPASGESGTGPAKHHVQGTVKVMTVPVARKVAVLRKDTLQPLAHGMSRADGKFHLVWYGYDGPFFFVAFDAEGAVDYNAQVFDHITA